MPIDRKFVFEFIARVMVIMLVHTVHVRSVLMSLFLSNKNLSTMVSVINVSILQCDAGGF